MQIQYFRLSNNFSKILIACCATSCGKPTPEAGVSKTKTLLRAAELRVGDALDLPDLRDALKKLPPNQSFRFLSEFYGFSTSFGIPGYPEYELLDGWHRPLRFSFDGSKTVVWSIGFDAVNQFGSGDDIKSTIESKSANERGK